MKEWPKSPYKGLAYYGPDDSGLFAGRDIDIRNCATILANPRTRTLILHGKTGCGKSSFLRAGVIPQMENEGVAFEFMKENMDEFKALFIRCTSAPIDRISEAVYSFIDSNSEYKLRTPLGVDSIDLSPAFLGKENLVEFQEASRSSSFLFKSLNKLSKLLPNTLILILDQAEEVITLSSDGNDANKRDFFDFLKVFNSNSLDIKLIISLRTEYYGRFFSYMNIDEEVRTDAKHFLLDDLTLENMINAIKRPTINERIEGYASTPFEYYGFTFEANLPKEIASDISTEKREGGVLPILQIVCTQLHSEILAGNESKITKSHYSKLGKVQGIIDKHIRQCIKKIAKKNQLKFSEQDHDNLRFVLSSLADVKEDGSVVTKIKSKEDLEEYAFENGIDEKTAEILEDLSSPEYLILRRIEMLNDSSGNIQTSYSLGHDVIGLTLNSWLIQYKEKNKRQETENRLTLIGIAFIILLILTLGSFGEDFLSKNGKEIIKTKTDLKSIVAAIGNQVDKPTLNMQLAVHAQKIANSVEANFYSKMVYSEEIDTLEILKDSLEVLSDELMIYMPDGKLSLSTTRFSDVSSHGGKFIAAQTTDSTIMILNPDSGFNEIFKIDSLNSMRFTYSPQLNKFIGIRNDKFLFISTSGTVEFNSLKEFDNPDSIDFEYLKNIYVYQGGVFLFWTSVNSRLITESAIINETANGYQWKLMEHQEFIENDTFDVIAGKPHHLIYSELINQSTSHIKSYDVLDKKLGAVFNSRINEFNGYNNDVVFSEDNTTIAYAKADTGLTILKIEQSTNLPYKPIEMNFEQLFKMTNDKDPQLYYYFANNRNVITSSIDSSQFFTLSNNFNIHIFKFKDSIQYETTLIIPDKQIRRLLFLDEIGYLVAITHDNVYYWSLNKLLDGSKSVQVVEMEETKKWRLMCDLLPEPLSPTVWFEHFQGYSYDDMCFVKDTTTDSTN